MTDTAVTKYRTTYFRHDDWSELCKPIMEGLTQTLYQKLPESDQRILRKNPKPHAVLRLLPKANGVRPIANLKRRVKVRLGDCPAATAPHPNHCRSWVATKTCDTASRSTTH